MRKSGILMPLFSLPSDFAVGTMGKGAYDFVDFLKCAGQKVWQILPLCPADYTNSPYQSVSCFAGNVLFIDFNLLKNDGLLKSDEPRKYDGGTDTVDYDYAKKQSEKLLRLAFSRFQKDRFEPDYSKFLMQNEFWLYDYALYCAIKQSAGGVSWDLFPLPLKNREAAALSEFKKSHEAEIEYYIFTQFIFYKQWDALKAYANKCGVEIFGDMPIYAAYDSADVWAHKKCFLLNEDCKPELVSGTPPDAFSKTGQIWGSPLYDFDYLKNTPVPYYWWKARICHALKIYDTVRIDHFRAFSEFFAIPSGDKTAEKGRWIAGPKEEIFDAVKQDFCGKLSIVAEDLGIITDSVRKLLKATGFAGMKVLQFGFDGNPDNPYLPYNYEKNTVAYIGTHDNATLKEFEEENPENALRLKNYIGKTDKAFNWAVIRLLMSSAADTVIFTMQDIMGTGKDTRINTPATTKNNWVWRIDASCPNSWLAGILNELTKAYGR